MVEQHRDITFADLKMKISEGWGWEEFEAKYGLSKTRLKRHIKQNLCKTDNFARGIIRDIDNNSKRKRKQGQPQAAAKTGSSEVKPEEVTTPKKSAKTTKSKMIEEATPVDAVVSSEASSIDKLAGLKREEASQSKIVAELEQDYRKQVDEYEDSIKKKHTLEIEYGKLQNAIAAKAKEYAELSLETESQRDSIKSTLEEKQKAESVLADVRQQIADLETIKIFAYRDGTLEADGNAFMDDTGYMDVCTKLLGSPECQDILTKETTMLARLVCIMDHAEKRVEITFENEDLEQIFTELHSVRSTA